MGQEPVDLRPRASGLTRRALLGGTTATTALFAFGAFPEPAAASGPAVPSWILWNHPFKARYPVFPGGHFGSTYYCTDAAGTTCASRESIGLGTHTGVDYSPSAGTPIYSVAAGKVTLVSTSGSWGHHVEVDHGDGCRTTYAHMAAGSIAVAVDQVIPAARRLGDVGNTGSAVGAHLHLVMTVNGVLRDSHPIVGNAPLAGSPGVPASEDDMPTAFNTSQTNPITLTQMSWTDVQTFTGAQWPKLAYQGTALNIAELVPAASIFDLTISLYVSSLPAGEHVGVRLGVWNKTTDAVSGQASMTFEGDASGRARGNYSMSVTLLQSASRLCVQAYSTAPAAVLDWWGADGLAW